MTTWSIPIPKLARKSREGMNVTVGRATAELFGRVVLRSPVDTGRFRANWNVSVGEPNYETTTSTNQARGSAEAAKAASYGAGDIVYLCNNLAYARPLEYGWSAQAPNGMVRVSVVESTDIVRSVSK